MRRLKPDWLLAQVADLLQQRMLALDLRADQAAGALAPWRPGSLAAWLQPGQTLALLGSSGAGKCTLANALVRAYGAAAGAAAQVTGAVRADDSRGHHTTTARSLLSLPGGACIRLRCA